MVCVVALSLPLLEIFLLSQIGTIINSFPFMFACRFSTDAFDDLSSQLSSFATLQGRPAHECSVVAPISTAAIPVVAHFAKMSSPNTATTKAMTNNIKPQGSPTALHVIK